MYADFKPQIGAEKNKSAKISGKKRMKKIARR